MMASLFCVLVGLAIGSFLNVVIHRLPLDQSVIRPRSHCPKCKAPVAIRHNIPLLGFLMLRGRCATCFDKISFRYPLIEFVTAVLFWLSWKGTGLDPAQIRLWTFLSIGIAVFFIDLDHRIIPDELSIGGWAFGLCTSPWDPTHTVVSLFAASFGAFLILLGFAFVYEKMTGRNGLGGGDIKFVGTMGAFLGIGGVWTSIVLGSLVGSVVGTAAALLMRRKSVLREAIPFGPFLVSGAFIELFFEVSKWMNL